MQEEKSKQQKPKEEKPKVEKTKEEKPKEEKPKEEKPKTEKPKAEKPKEEKPAPAEKKRKKINRMTLKEVDKKLEEIKEKMGNFTSKYAMELLKRKKELSGQ